MSDAMFWRKRVQLPLEGAPYRTSARTDAPRVGRGTVLRQLVGAVVATVLIAAAILACLLSMLAAVGGVAHAFDALFAW